LIGVQGVLGMYRVGLNNLHVAWIHGSFAQIVFATLVTVAMVMGQSSQKKQHTQEDEADGLHGLHLRRWSQLCVAMVFLQAVLGGMAP